MFSKKFIGYFFSILFFILGFVALGIAAYLQEKGYPDDMLLVIGFSALPLWFISLIVNWHYVGPLSGVKELRERVLKDLEKIEAKEEDYYIDPDDYKY